MLVPLLPLLFACSEIGDDNTDTNSNPVRRGSLLVIDEKDQLLNRLDLGDLELSRIAVVGSAANDIEIDDHYAYVVNSLNSSLYLYDLSNGGVLTVVFPSSGYPDYANRNPYNLAVDSNLIYVTMSAGNSLTVVDKATLSILTDVALPSPGYPEGVAFDAGRIYVATSAGFLGFGDPGNQSNSRVVVLSKQDYATEAQIPVLRNPQSVAVSPDGRVYAACTGLYNTNTWAYEGGGLVAVEPAAGATNLVETDVQFVTVKADGAYLYAIDDGWDPFGLGLVIYSTNGLRVTNLLAGQNLKGLDFDGERIYLSSSAYTYGPECAYFVAKSNYAVTVISNVPGGDAALWK